MEYLPDTSDLEYYRSLNWTESKWTPSPALIEKRNGAIHLFVGQRFEPEYFDFAPDGWNHDHCEICQVTLCENPEGCETEGYKSDHLWLCKNCFNKYL
jgi:hypothetical protein